jgi:hypothetical protein
MKTTIVWEHGIPVSLDLFYDTPCAFYLPSGKHAGVLHGFPFHFEMDNKTTSLDIGFHQTLSDQWEVRWIQEASTNPNENITCSQETGHNVNVQWHREGDRFEGFQLGDYSSLPFILFSLLVIRALLKKLRSNFILIDDQIIVENDHEWIPFRSRTSYRFIHYLLLNCVGFGTQIGIIHACKRLISQDRPSLVIAFCVSGWFVGYILSSGFGSKTTFNRTGRRILNPLHPHLLLNTLVFPILFWKQNPSQNDLPYDALLWLGIGVTGMLISRAIIPSLLNSNSLQLSGTRTMYRSQQLRARGQWFRGFIFICCFLSILFNAQFGVFNRACNAIIVSLSCIYFSQVSWMSPVVLFCFIGTFHAMHTEEWTDFFLFGSIGWYVYRYVLYLISFNANAKEKM